MARQEARSDRVNLLSRKERAGTESDSGSRCRARPGVRMTGSVLSKRTKKAAAHQNALTRAIRYSDQPITGRLI